MPLLPKINLSFISFKEISLALALCVAPAGLAAQNPGEALRKQFQVAKAALESGDLARAEAEYRATLALGLRQLGNLALSENRYAQATQLLDDAVKATPQDADLRVEAAIAFFRSGDSAKAKDLIQAVLAEHPENARAHNVLGSISLFRGDTDASIVELKKAVELQDDFETGYFIGVASLKAKKLSEASAWFQQLQVQMGNSAAIHVLFGRAYSITHFPEPAIDEFRKAIDLDPQYPRAHGLLGYSYLELYGEESYPRARQEFERELKLRPDQYYFLTLLGIATVALRDFPAAEATLKHAVRLNPNEPGPYLYLGETYSETRRTALAVQALQKYVSLVTHPEEMLRDVSRAYFLLGQSLMRLGRVEEAKRALLDSQKYREAKFRYDAKHIFDEKPSPEGADSRASEPIEALLETAAPGESDSTEAIAQGGVEPSAVAAPVSAANQLEPESGPAK